MNMTHEKLCELMRIAVRGSDNVDNAVEAFRSLLPQQQEAIPADCDVRKIMLRVDPGSDGMGVEVYAKNVGEVETLLGELSDKVDDPNIVRCVNSHDALVKALQQARKWIREQMADNGCPEDRLDNPPAGSHLANIEAALAAAGAPQ